ncbi:MAG: hypothetical protein F2735_01990 [Actinobacteria bacterium]|uniref:Unannotated protein n=1 Tax=freshwater metagenome TaxID=449393 RepID=A0A6J6X3X0_9ZZZZ|nr:hypothetical protein [Actinomycetota bacterium]
MNHRRAQPLLVVACVAAVLLLAANVVMIVGVAASAVPQAFANGVPVCPRGFFQVSANHFYSVAPATSDYSAIGSDTVASGDLNAIGYRTQDHSIYGVVSTAASLSDLYRIDSAGVFTDVGPITPPVYQPQGGDFTISGHLLVYNSADNWFDINVETRVATPVLVDGVAWDFARALDIVVVGDVAYGFSGTILYTATLTIDGAGVTTAIYADVRLITGASPRERFSSAWSDSSGALYFFRDTQHRLYSLASPTSTSAVLVASLVDMSVQGDGASCPTALSPYAAPTANPDAYSASAGYTLTATAGATPAGVLDNDDGGSALEVSSFTAASHGEVTMAVGAGSTGSFTYTPTLANFVGDDSFTYIAADTQPTPATSASTTVAIHVTDVPTVTTLAATGIGETAATLHGTVNARSADTTVAFCWGTAPNLASCIAAAATESPVFGIEDTSVSLDLATLATGTTYYYRVSGTNAVDTANGAITSFTTRQQPAWTDTALGAMVVGVAFTDAVAASGVLPPTYAITVGALPIGLSLAESTGAITGTPSHSGAFAFTIAATNLSGSVDQEFTGTVDESPQWTDVVLGQMVVGTLFADAVLAAGMPDPAYAVTAGALPSGLLLSANTGSITGTPTAPGGAFDFTVRAANGIGDATLHQFTGYVFEAPAWIDVTLGQVVVGTSFADGVSASGVMAPTYAVSIGALPIGLWLNATTGAITGLPSAFGAFTFTVAASNVSGEVEHQFVGSVYQPPVWSDVVLAEMLVGAAFNDDIRAAGLPAPTYSVMARALPIGLTLHATSGAITGTPTAPGGDFDVTLKASNSFGHVEYRFVGTVYQAPTWTDVTLAAMTMGESFADGLAAAAIPTPTYSVTAGSLPAGLSLNVVTGAIAGIVGAPGGAFDFTVTATNAKGSVSYRFVGSVALYGFVAMTPARLLDTRDGAVKYPAGSDHELLMVGRSGVPSDAIAVLLSVTATDSDGSGFITLYPCGSSRPWASNLNFVFGLTVSNAASVFVDVNGRVCIYTSVATHVVIDVDGAWSSASGSGALHAFTPARLVDSRVSSGAKLAAGAIHELVVAGVGGVAPDATAVVLSVTATEPDWAGFVTVYPCGGARPWASNVNFAAGQTVSTPATSAVGALGTICLYSSAPTHLVVDVMADFSPSAGSGVPISGQVERLADTRQITGSTNGNKLGGGAVLHVAVPALATAITLNVTVTEPTAAGFVTAYPCTATPPFVSNVNFVSGQTVAEAVTVAVSASSEICVFASVPTHVVVDLSVSFGAG